MSSSLSISQETHADKMYIMDLGYIGRKKKKKIYLTLLFLLQKCRNTNMDFYVSPFNYCMTITEKLKFDQKHSKTVMM